MNGFTEFGDWPYFDISGLTKDRLVAAFNLVHESSASGYEIIDGALVLFWGGKGDSQLPFKLDRAGMADFAWNWLKQVEYPHEPDHDGDNSKGWRIYTEDWGQVKDKTYGFIAIEPFWVMYGK